MNLLQILYTVILYPLEQIIELSYFLFDKLFDNPGIATLGVSLTVTLLCLPLYIVAESWEETERNIQTKMKPKVDRIKSVFKGDEQYMILTTYYRQNHYHPMMALRSSFGLLIQIPFFMAAYHCLSHMEALQGTSFAFIRDMGQPDAVFKIGSFSVNILPIAMTIINCISGTIYSKGHGVREKIQIYGMAAIFLVILYDSPAGLVLYWTMNNLFSMIKNIFYKMKNPLKILYLCMVCGLTFMAIFILFIYDGGASMKKRIPAAFALLVLIPIPFYLKAVNYLLTKPLGCLVESKKARFSLFAFSSVALTLFMGLLLPSSIISTSVQEFSNIDTFGNPTEFLHYSFWQAFGIFVFWSGCIYFLFKEKIQTLLAFLFSCLLVCSIVNVYIFAGNYGSMDVTLKFIDGFKQQSSVFILGNAVCVVLVAACLIALLNFRKQNILSTVCMLLAGIFGLISIVNSAKISGDYKAYQKILASKDSDSSLTPKFHFTKDGKNVLVLMLDRCESSFFESIVKDNPSLKESYKGFTFYPNTISFNGHTLMASPAVYGGYEYTPWEMNKRDTVELKEKHNESLLLLPKLFTETSDYTATLTDLSWGNYSYVSDMSFVKDYNSPKISGTTLNARYTGDYKSSHPGISQITLSGTLRRNLLWVSLFRSVPAAVRSAVYYKGSYLNGTVIDGDDNFIDWYSALYYMPELTDFTGNGNQLFVMANESTHFSKSIDHLKIISEEEKSRFSIPTDNYTSNTAVHLAVAKFLDYLKANDVYDNTRIIIVADHGIGEDIFDINYDGATKAGSYHKDHLNPILLVKDFYSNGELGRDETFMTNADVPSLALEGIIENPVNPFTGNPVTMDSKNDGVIVTTDDIFMPYHSKSKYQFTCKESKWWTVKDNIFMQSNWKQLNENN